MQEERELLYNSVFPQLQARCEERGLTFDVVDLRANAGNDIQALAAVAAGFANEIDRCRPHFIGLLGDRCSGAADIPESSYDRIPWLKDEVAAGKPLLELEFQHGALRKPAGSRARFYLRDTAYTPARSLLPPDAKDVENTRRLKEAVRTSGLPVCENYANPAALGAQLAADLTRVVDSFISSAPATTQLSPGQLEQLLSASRAGVAVPQKAQGPDPGDAAPTATPAIEGAYRSPSASGRRVRIVHLAGSRARTMQEFNLDKQDEVWIGRDPVSHVRYAEADQPVSRAHMKIVSSFADPHSYILIARGRNGTYINNIEVTGSAALHDGDIVQVGHGGPIFRFEQFPKMAGQEGWQEPELAPIVAAVLPVDEPGRPSGATTVLKFDAELAKAMLEASKQQAAPPEILKGETDSKVVTPLSATEVDGRTRFAFQPKIMAGIVVAVLVLLVFVFMFRR
jgi:hypothetical protein